MDIAKTAEIIDGIFSDVLMKKIKADKAEERLSSFLSAASINDHKKHFEFAIVHNAGKEPFFAFRVFPVIADMQMFLSETTTEVKSFKDIINMWRNIENWYIEIDDTVFDRTSITFNPKELTALLLHEIGHTVFSDGVIERFYRAYKEAYVRMKSADRATIKALYVLYMIPLSFNCMLRNWTNGKNEIKQEEYADSILVKKLGYTESLISAITKIIKAYGNSDLNMTDSEKNSKIESSVQWANVNIGDLIRRRNHLKDDLFYDTIKTNSNFVKAITLSILNKLGVELKETYTGNAMECTLELLSSPDLLKKYEPVFNLHKSTQFAQAVAVFQSANESYGKIKPPKLPTQFDVDSIQVESDRIQNHSDRIYVLDLIYDEIDQVSQYREFIADDQRLLSRYDHKFSDMLKQLDEIRKSVLAKKNFDKNYEVFVKYPKGYEG